MKAYHPIYHNTIVAEGGINKPVICTLRMHGYFILTHVPVTDTQYSLIMIHICYLKNVISPYPYPYPYPYAIPVPITISYLISYLYPYNLALHS